MSKADVIFKKMCRDIIDNGTDTRGEAVRPHWPDGTAAYTVKQFGVVNRYDLREEFPAVTLRKTAIKSATDEILWIWQKKSNNIHELHSHIWDEWADADGSIGKAYGYQLSKKYIWKDITEEGLKQVYGDAWKDNVLDVVENKGTYEYVTEKEKVWNGWDIHTKKIGDITKYHVWYDISEKVYLMDQVDKVLYDLKVHPFSRRIMTNLYDFKDLPEMNLYPCAYSCTFNVTEENGQKVLNMLLNQRSQDTLTANNWNVCQYAVLLAMIARHVDMIPGVLLHVIADAHIYDRHIPLVEELISRPEHPAPAFWLNPNKHDFYSFVEFFFKTIEEFFKRSDVDFVKQGLWEYMNIPMLRIRYDQVDMIDDIVKDFVDNPKKYIKNHNTYLSEEEYWEPLKKEKERIEAAFA